MPINVNIPIDPKILVLFVPAVYLTIAFTSIWKNLFIPASLTGPRRGAVIQLIAMAWGIIWLLALTFAWGKFGNGQNLVATGMLGIFVGFAASGHFDFLEALGLPAWVTSAIKRIGANHATSS